MKLSDKDARERVDKLNQADSFIFQTEKQLKELGDKIPADKKAPIESALTRLKEAQKAQDHCKNRCCHRRNQYRVDSRIRIFI